MDEIIKFDNLRNVLERFAKELQAEYKANLKKNDRIATGTLYNTAKCEVVKGKYLVVIHLQDYWRYIEGGRDITRNDGIGILRKNILDWIEVKHILPTPNGDKLPTPEQLAYLISRKIHTVGYGGTQDLSKATDTIYDKFQQEIYDAIDKDWDAALINIFKLPTKQIK